jgi:hypothetical protein
MEGDDEFEDWDDKSFMGVDAAELKRRLYAVLSWMAHMNDLANDVYADWRRGKGSKGHGIG